MQTVLKIGDADPTSTSRSFRPEHRLILHGVLVLVMLSVVLASFFFTNAQQQTLSELREAARQARVVQEAIVEADSYVLRRALAPDAIDDTAYIRAIDTLRARRDVYLSLLDPVLAAINGPSDRTAPGLLDSLETTWRDVVALARSGNRKDAMARLADQGTSAAVERLRGATDVVLTRLNAQFSVYEKRIEIGTLFVLACQLLIGVLMLLAVISASREAAGRAAAIAETTASRRQVKRLFNMTDMLQSATDHLDANAVLRATANELIQGFGGCLYVFNNSRDRLTLSTSWGMRDDQVPPAMIGLEQCWALKRGKPHINVAEGTGLCCAHHLPGSTVLEIPMIARGEILGLLQVFASGADANERIGAVLPIGSAMADAMSLALSNLALREKLRNQALRDPLTGLYNRRYMEDSLDRFVRLAERENRKIAVIMIDLDHFKRLNDEHGHATGDAVLREAASAIIGALRETDVACRYGGEEMIVLLPDCDLDNAADKAEVIRQRIESLSGQRGAAVSASLGVSAIPTTANGTTDLVRSADAALYKAKQAGRNRVATAPARSARKEVSTPPMLETVRLQAAE